MGSSTWSDDVHDARVTTRAVTNTPVFKHDADVRSGIKAAALHPSLDIRGKTRESRDSTAHPRSKSIAVMFDHTGSMGDIPALLQEKLPRLPALLLSKGYCEDAQVLFGCIGDAHDGSVAPLQVGQFESGNEMDDAFEAMLIEKRGGGTHQESYELAMYFFAHKVQMDCFELRGERGLLFIIGDEMPYPYATRADVAKHIGGGGELPQDDTRIEQVAADLQKKFDVFFLIPNNTTNYHNSAIRNAWAALIGPERVIKLDDPAAVCETIAGTVGLMEGAVDAAGIRTDLADVGASAKVVAAVTSGLDALARGVAVAKVGSGSLPARVGKSAVERL